MSLDHAIVEYKVVRITVLTGQYDWHSQCSRFWFCAVLTLLLRILYLIRPAECVRSCNEIFPVAGYQHRQQQKRRQRQRQLLLRQFRLDVETCSVCPVWRCVYCIHTTLETAAAFRRKLNKLQLFGLHNPQEPQKLSDFFAS